MTPLNIYSYNEHPVLLGKQGLLFFLLQASSLKARLIIHSLYSPVRQQNVFLASEAVTKLNLLKIPRQKVFEKLRLILQPRSVVKNPKNPKENLQKKVQFTGVAYKF